MKTTLLCVILTALVTSCSAPKTIETAQAIAPNILTRAAWGANAPVSEMKTHTISRLTIHHTATLQKPARSLAEKMVALQKFSQNPGTLGNGKAKPAWPDVPYHFYIDCHGDIAEGREWQFVGDTNTAYDPTGHLLVVLEGNFEEDQPTPAQMESLRRLITFMSSRHGIAAEKIGAHKDFAETLCPGKHLYERMTEIKQPSATQ